MKNYYFITLIFCMFFYSCAKQTSTTKEMISLSISKDPNYQPHRINESLSGDYQKYMEYFEGTDYEIGISSGKDGGLPGGTSISCISGISHVRNNDITKTVLNDLPSISAFVDGIEISNQSLSQTKASNGLIDCFGKVVKFAFCNNIQTKSTDSNTGEVDMYVPKAIEFLFPCAKSEEDLNPLCYYKDFVIRWNKDENNSNGILVVVDWTGSMILGDDIPDAHVCRVAKFPDIGEAVLPVALFDGIPDTAHCDLLIFRGNIENVENGEFSYKLIGKTHHQISFILIREIA